MQARQKYCRVYSCLYFGVFLKTNHMHSCLGPVLKARHEGLKAGDTLHATVCAALYCSIAFRCEKKLASVKQVLTHFKREAKVYKQEAMWTPAIPLEQAILNLMGHTDKPNLLDGDAIPVENIDTFIANAKSRDAERLLCVTYYYQMLVAYIFDDLELAIKMVEEYLDLEYPLEGLVVGTEVVFLYGLTSLAQARKTNEVIWKNRGHESMRKVRKLAKDCPKNYHHKLLLLEAEFAFTAGRKNEASEKYEQAVTFSRNNQFIQDQALSYELAAKFHAEECNESKASQYYGKAHDLYVEWGATSKADHLRENFPF